MNTIKNDYNEFTKELSENGEESSDQGNYLNQDASFFGV
jgi:hypothetical protein